MKCVRAVDRYACLVSVAVYSGRITCFCRTLLRFASLSCQSQLQLPLRLTSLADTSPATRSYSGISLDQLPGQGILPLPRTSSCRHLCVPTSQNPQITRFTRTSHDQSHLPPQRSYLSLDVLVPARYT